MGTITEDLTLLASNKAGIKTAIESKGVEVGDAPLSTYANKIDSISQGADGIVTTPSKYHLTICTLSVDDGYILEHIPISPGDVIALGDGQNVAASSGWDDGIYHMDSHPEMLFQSWASSVNIINNELFIPDCICGNIHAGAIYVPSDGLNHFIEHVRGEGFTHRSDDNSYILEGANTVTLSNTSLSACWIGSNVTDLSNSGAFFYCNSLHAVSLPNNITSIGTYAFRECHSLEILTIPSHVTEIGTSTFSGANGLMYINIPYQATTVGSSSFSTDYAIGRSLYMPEMITEIKGYTFYDCYTIINFNIPSGVTVINTQTFSLCGALKFIELPAGITSIGEKAFYKCQSLFTIILNSVTPPTLSNINAFEDCQCSFLVPEESVDAYKAATNWNEFSDYILANTEENRNKFIA